LPQQEAAWRGATKNQRLNHEDTKTRRHKEDRSNHQGTKTPRFFRRASRTRVIFLVSWCLGALVVQTPLLRGLLLRGLRVFVVQAFFAARRNVCPGAPT
jgi:hypothetical protein